MLKRIIIRLDDICPDMNYDKFERMRAILEKYKIQPIIGVIPDNKYDLLKEYRTEGRQLTDIEIWNEIGCLQDELGWDIALHGYNHLKLSDDHGILKRNKKSEFSNIEQNLQKEKIVNGLNKLKENNLKAVAFMAPFHSFDKNTLMILSDLGVKYITDGIGVFPYKLNDMILMPVPQALVWYLPFGTYTVCLHTNSMSEEKFIKFEKFIKHNRTSIISFSQAIENITCKQPSNIVRLLFNYIIDIFLNMAVASRFVMAKFLGV